MDIGLDWQFAPAALDQYCQEHAGRAAIIEDFIQRSAYRAPGLQDVIDQEDCAVFDLEAFNALKAEHEISFLDEDLNSLLERSLAGLNRIHRIVQDLRYFGSDRKQQRGLVDLGAVIRAAVGLIRHEARFRAELVVEIPNLPMIRSDGGRLSQVILNVVVNGVQSIAPGNPANNRVAITAELKPDTVVLSVSDTGAGMKPDVLANVFEPFFTTKAPGEGTGLGLAISRDIMRSLGGEIVAESTAGKGSQFTLIIPRDSD